MPFNREDSFTPGNMASLYSINAAVSDDADDATQLRVYVRQQNDTQRRQRGRNYAATEVASVQALPERGGRDTSEAGMLSTPPSTTTATRTLGGWAPKESNSVFT